MDDFQSAGIHCRSFVIKFMCVLYFVQSSEVYRSILYYNVFLIQVMILKTLLTIGLIDLMTLIFGLLSDMLFLLHYLFFETRNVYRNIHVLHRN